MSTDRSRRISPLLAGAALGLGAGDVLLGLNPHLLTPLAAARLLLGSALLGMLVLSPAALVRARSDRPPRAAWAAFAMASLLVAAVAEAQRQIWYAYLPNGARRVFVATVFAGLAVFAGAALQAFWGRPSRRAMSTLGLAAGLFVLPPFAGRQAPERSGLSMPPALPRTATRSLLVVGLEGVSWDLVSSGASDGSLPVLARLLKEGAGGPLAPLRPYDRAAAWTTAATGKRPRKHGVVAEAEWTTPLGVLRLLPRLAASSWLSGVPIAARRSAAGGRRSLTFWEILAARGHKVALLNWPASWPAHEGLVLWATERLFDGDASPDAARPPDTAADARRFRVGLDRLERPLVRALLPEGLGEAARSAAAPLSGAARDLSVAGATLAVVPTGPGSVSALVLSGLARVAREFGPPAEPSRYFGSAPRSAEARVAALHAYYRFLDETLGDLLEREGRDRTLCVFSPVGFGPPPPLDAAAAFVTGRVPKASPLASPDGFLVLSGSGIRTGARLTSADLLDLAPTLLVLAGEPIARDMDGRVLAESFDARYAESASIPVVTTFEPEGPQ